MPPAPDTFSSDDLFFSEELPTQPVPREPAEPESAAELIPDVPPAAGSLLAGRYQLEEFVAQGSVSKIYRANDLLHIEFGLESAAAGIKVLDAAAPCDDEPGLKLQLRCIVRMQRLSHPNIVNVFSLERDGDVSFSVMEWLDGESLATLLDRTRPESADRAFCQRVIDAAGGALQYAHGQGVVHGDLKPANVFVTADGTVKLLDFAFGAAAAVPGAKLLLTPAYASCEQLEREPANEADDLFAFACLIYRMLAGQRPFGAQTALEAEAQGLQPARPPHLSDRQWSALRSALSFRRANRISSIRLLVAAFDEEVAPESRTGALAGTRARRIRLAAAVTGMTVLLAALFAWSLRGGWENLQQQFAAADVPAARSPDIRSSANSPAPAFEEPVPDSTVVETRDVPARQQPPAGEQEPVDGSNPGHATRPEPELVTPPALRPSANPAARQAMQPPARLGFAQTRLTVNEQDGFARLSVQAPPGHEGLTLSVSATAGSARLDEDFVLPSNQLELPPGETDYPLLVLLINDAREEYVEDVVLRLETSNATVPVIRPEATLIIVDDDGQ